VSERGLVSEKPACKPEKKEKVTSRKRRDSEKSFRGAEKKRPDVKKEGRFGHKALIDLAWQKKYDPHDELEKRGGRLKKKKGGCHSTGGGINCFTSARARRGGGWPQEKETRRGQSINR